MRNSWYKKGLVFGIIIVFIGVGINPAMSIDIKSSLDNEGDNFKDGNFNKVQTEIPIQIYEPNEVKTYDLSLTREQKEEFDTFVESFKQDLEKAVTIEETILIYNNAIATLYEIGLIPKCVTVERLQDIITGHIQLKFLDNLDMIKKTLPYKNKEINSNCLVSGSLSTYSGPVLRVLFPFIRIMIILLTRIWVGDMYFGTYFGFNGYHPAVGWISTQSSQGSWDFAGEFYGHLGASEFAGDFEYIGVEGFIGMHFGDFYIGYAKSVNIGTERPGHL